MPFTLSLRHRPRIVSLLRLLFPIAFIISSVTAQESRLLDTLGHQQPDTLRPDSFKKKSIPLIGYLRQSTDSSSLLHSSQFLHTDAFYVGDILWKIPGAFLRELGEPGQPSQFSISGVDARGISLRLDGRPLNDPITGGYNLYDLPIEYIDEMESIQGSEALSETPDAAGGTINFVTHQYDNSRPLTKFRFFQGAFEHILSDGVFAQNLSRNVNAMFGFQRHVTDGRFSNSAYDSWNFRLRFRYNPSDRVNAWISEFYTKSTIGLNGGVDPNKSPSIYDEVTAVVRDATTFQIASRHDLTAGAAARFLSDTSSITKALVYYSSIDREYTIGGGQGFPPLFSNLQGSSFLGSRIEQRLGFSLGAIDLGAQYEHRKVDQSSFLDSRTENFAAGTASITVNPSDWIKGTFTSGMERLVGDNGFSWGLNLEASVNNWVSIWGDYSRSHRFPTIQELYWKDSTISHASPLSKETHSFIQAGVKLRSGTLSLSVAGFHRRIENAIQVAPWTADDGSGFSIRSTPYLELNGATADLRLPIWNFEIAGDITYTNSKDDGVVRHLVPTITSVSELSYRDRFGDGALDLKLAVRLKAMSYQDGLQFLPIMMAYAQEKNLVQMPGFASLDFYTVAKLGDAYLTLEWENPFDVNTYLVPYYPLMGRNIKLGVNWTFTD